MKSRYFDINEEGCSIRCKLYTADAGGSGRIILFGHGFGGHKDNKAAEKLAGRAVTKVKDLAVLAFDWPCHGGDARANLSLGDCDTYITLLLKTCRERFGAKEITANATSFGGYLFLKYMAEHGNPFRKVAFRCPAVNMYESMMDSILTADEKEKLAKGKPVLAGFDRKVKITQPFLEELKAADIRKNDYLEMSEDIRIIHGRKDEIIPFAEAERFADDNLIEFIPVDNADHRFTDPHTMDIAIHEILSFLL